MYKKKLNIITKDNLSKIYINPEIYPLDVIYSTAYIFLENSYFHIEKNNNEFIINILPKNKNNNSEKIALEFNNQLINYLDYKKNFENNKGIRQILLQRALITNDPNLISDENLKIKEEEIVDPSLLTIPWENDNKNE